MKSLPIISLLASVAYAQSASSNKAPSSSGATSTSDISQGCQSFLKNLNSDTSLAPCTKAIISVASPFRPGGTAPTNNSITPSTLNSLCQAPCDENTMKSKLVLFYSACSAELTSKPNQDIVRNYDVLYALLPFRDAVCAKNDNGDFCVQQASAPSSPNVSGLKDHLAQQPLTSTYNAALVPNTTTFAASNLLFLFMQPNASSDVLCTTCSRNIMTSYIKFASDVPYGPGINTSPMMKGQSDLYNAITSKCGQNFLSGVVQAAGSLSGNGPLNKKSGAVGSMSAIIASPLMITLGVLAGSLIL